MINIQNTKKALKNIKVIFLFKKIDNKIKHTKTKKNQQKND